METRTNTLKRICTFLVITTIISTGIFIWIYNGAGDSLVAVIPMMFTPGISAVLTAVIFKEKIGSFGWKFGKPKYLLYSYLFPLAVSIIAYGLFWMTNYADFTTSRVVNYQWAKMIGFELPVPAIIGMLSKMIVAFLFTALIVLGEEVGWSGFLTPQLRKIFSVPVTSIIIGTYWSVWHFPAIIGGFYGNDSPLWIALPGFTMVLIGTSLARTILVDKSKSLWTGVVLHASHNILLMGMFLELTKQTSDLDIHLIVSETGPFLGVICIFSAVLFWKLINGGTKT